MRFVFLPGMDGTGRLFSALLNVWKEQQPPLIISYPPDKTLDYSSLQSYVIARLPDEPYVLIAESFSGPIAMGIGATHPALLKGIVLCATFVRRPIGPVSVGVSHFVSSLLFRKGLVSSKAMRFFLKREGVPPEQLNLFEEAIQHVLPEVMAHRIRQALTVDRSDALRLCDVPMLYIHARKDRILIGVSPEKMCEGNSRIRSVSIHSGHFVLQTKPAETLKEIKDFILTLGVA